MIFITIYVAIGLILTLILLKEGVIKELAEEESENDKYGITFQQWYIIFSLIYFFLWPAVILTLIFLWDKL